ncbi:MAG: tRNA (adenosine(37)-N6)-threonylcarbamoyltransferase complex transferase subunit TsaD [Chlamydiales bacterium]
MITLGIETTCDETACALVEDGKKILAHTVYSQSEMHEQYGGVFPELAARRHLDVLLPTLQETLHQAKISEKEIDLIAVAKGPGLIGALLIGLNTAKTLSLAWEKPFIGVNHVEAHLYAAMMDQPSLLFPALGVVVSGGHTFLTKILNVGHYELIGTTVDDAIGEAFDKVASLLGLPYPGGPAIEKLALKGNSSLFPFRAGRVKENPWDFSFSGLKTSVLYAVKGANSNKHSPLLIREEDKADIAASFQETALGDIVQKSLRAIAEFGCKAVYLGGGVTSSKRLRALFAAQNPSVPLFWPAPGLSLDNAAMIAGLGYHTFLAKGKDALDLEPMTRIPLGKTPKE